MENITPNTALAKADGHGAINAFASTDAFEGAQRMAKALAASTLMPEAYRKSIPNTLIAIELASRIGASVLMVAQNLDVIHGRPAWRASFLIATVNACGRFSPLRYRWQGTEGRDDWGCRAVAKDAQTGDECLGPLVTINTAKKEGWYQRNGSKWQTLPELMLTYRAATFWARVFAPELSLGMRTGDEVIDTYGEATQASAAPTLEAALRAEGVAGALPAATADVEVLDAELDSTPVTRQPGEDDE